MCAAGVLVILGIFAFVDYVWNGTFVDWFTRNYMRETGSVYAGKDVIIQEQRLQNVIATTGFIQRL